MFKDLLKNYVYPIAVFSGGMVGVGFLSLPYVTTKVGIWVMLGYFVAITSIILLINLIFCEISLKTPDFKRFPGFVGYYLGKWPKYFVFVLSIFGTIATLLAYLLVGGQFLTSVLQPIFSGSALLYVFIYFLVASSIIYFDIKVISRVELWFLFLLFLSFFLIFIIGFQHIKLTNILTLSAGFTQGGNLSNVFYPYGAMFFALWAVGLIPETEEMLIGKKKNLKKVIIISTIIVSIFYFLFVLLITGIMGKSTSETALYGLQNFLNPALISVSLIIGVMATFVAFITQGLIFKKTLIFDLKIKHWQAFVMTCCPPMILFLLGINSIMPILSIVGGVVLGINGIIILLMYKKIGGKKIIIYPLSVVFLLGAIYEIVYFLF